MRYIIVGCGVAGTTAAQEIARMDPDGEVHLFGAEPYPYYRRPLLWQFVAGKVEQSAVFYRIAEWYAAKGIRLHLGVTVTGIDLDEKRLAVRSSGEPDVAYDRLLLATGGRSFVPSCEGTEKDGVFTLRTLDDALAIRAYARQVPKAIVVGGGLLGLETARALQTAGLEVTVIEFLPYLMPRQLDEEGAGILRSILEKQGLTVITGATTRAVLGSVRADCIRLQDGRIVDGDLVIFATGMRSETALAGKAEMEVNRGIVVDEQLRVRRTGGDPLEDVFAAGDAAEFRGRVYGTIPPAIEQARIAAANAVHPGSAAYGGTQAPTTLKIAGAELTVLGEGVMDASSAETAGEIVELRTADAAAGRYRKLVLRDGRVVGATLLNDPANARVAGQLIERNVDASPYAEQILDDDFDLASLLVQRVS
jgi:nitrite reductase (NADH) large subunit